MNNPVFVLRCLREQGTEIRAERTTRVYAGQVQPWISIIFGGRMPSPVQMAKVKQLRGPILEMLERDGCIDELNEVDVPFDYDYSGWF